ncbi:MAG: adenylosuccinate synthase [Chloroflexota bacterium]
MPVQAIVGAQWGDEGKGKITDLLAQSCDLTIRFNGGGNAGHTIVNQYGEFSLHLIPSGIFNSSGLSLIGTGAVADFELLADELDALDRQGVSTHGLRISDRAQVVMPYHLLLDRLEDEARGESALGTTRRGIGPAYSDKAARVGFQVADVMDEDTFAARLSLVLPQKNRLLADLYGHSPPDEHELLAQANQWRRRFGPLVVDQVDLLADALQDNREVLLEGQLGAMRDLDWGTYPYVTSSTTIAGGGAVGGGIPPTLIDRALGVVKAYTTAVGTGPLPTELEGRAAEELRERGHEYGATTGRPRRVGWFDAVAVRYAHRLNRFSSIAITKLDVLDGFPALPICVAYEVQGKRLTTVPTTPLLQRVDPVYDELPGWQGSVRGARELDALPAEARRYVQRIAELVGAPISLISVGPGRDETISASIGPYRNWSSC